MTAAEATREAKELCAKLTVAVHALNAAQAAPAAFAGKAVLVKRQEGRLKNLLNRYTAEVL